ncbi:MAG TPA: arginine repressor [Syntrophomonadaceae bacterium]|nr:arginine repressor [Syntrophomonadaceae bacterium]
MKLRRQQLILEIIESKPITTQEELAQELRNRGISTTQATISRDIKELQLVKVPAGGDVYRYARPQQQLESPRSQERLRRLFQDAVVNIDFSENIIVVRTLPGAAQGVASAIDQVGWREIIGTVAGDDTIFVIVKPREIVMQVVERLESLLV